ncbi:unnamed protein product [Victoria cruziana]
MRRETMEDVRMFENMEELSTTLADHVAELSETAVKERGAFSLALSGGDVPKSLRKLTGGPYLRTVDWTKWHVFWSDESLVPKRHPNSNYRQAKDDFLSKVPVLPGHVYPVNAGVPGERAAEEYEFGIRQHVRNRTVDVSRRSDCPRFDLVLLAVGPDGRVASLLPGHSLLEEAEGEDQWVAPVAGSPERVTFTLPVINSAANVALIAASSALRLPHASPAKRVSPVDGKLVWFVDAGACSS